MLDPKGLEAAAEALQEKYREFWSGSWPDTETSRELFEAGYTAYLAHAGEPDFAAAIAGVIKDESENEAACGWRSCTGCHETNEGAETGWYPYSKMFGCFVGSGCSECGGLGVVWEYWAKDALDRMLCDDPATPQAQARVKGLQWDEDEDGWWKASPIYGLDYEVRVTDMGAVRIRRPENAGWEPFIGSVDKAQAAAQADYERRILSALDAQITSTCVPSQNDGSAIRPATHADERMVEAAASIAAMVTEWYGNLALPKAHIPASIIAKRLSRFAALAREAGR